ncbi:hypothetical protein [Nonlabens ponticola]|uniref:Uncharacterized protein n=1 Tax=Nonlabens ponticola TaxID=2496866 RepID=A0A3S9MY52_9FLAO|nr:hypothetical protein [Nonlabens ponticola]AZQ44181.1 hypothetical protein EJ995_08025 [Nonlabens ponticola]
MLRVVKHILIKSKEYTLIAFFLMSTNALAHISEAHERIEKEAYKLLIEQEATENHPDGLSMFNYLVAQNYIKESDEASSAYPDLDLSRQFLSDRQIYHFMASSRYVMQALRRYDNIDEQQHYIISKALPECINLLYTLTRETIDNPTGANQAGRGIYVLMHAITDSYSREHTIRQPITHNIQNIKSWKLSRLFWPEVAKLKADNSNDEVETLVFLHSIEGKADAEWVDEEGNLNEEAKAAVNAIKELLIIIYQATQNKAEVDSLITSYIGKHFQPVGAVVNDQQFVFETENTTMDLSYEDGYFDNSNVLELDRYPHYSHMLTFQNGLSQIERPSFGYELGIHISPRAAFSSTSFFQRLPYGIVIGINENTDILPDASLVESLQFKAAAKVMFYLPLRNLVLEPRLGLGMTPLNSNDNNLGLLTGFDVAFNLGRDNNRQRTKRFSIGYEYDASGLHSYNSILLKAGFNNWQGRVVKK